MGGRGDPADVRTSFGPRVASTRMRKDVFLLGNGVLSPDDAIHARLRDTIRSVDASADVRTLSGYSFEYLLVSEAIRWEATRCLLTVMTDDCSAYERGFLDGMNVPTERIKRMLPPGRWRWYAYEKLYEEQWKRVRDRYEGIRVMADERAPVAFVSYVREDAAAVDQLCRGLERFGVRTWRDQSRLKPGTRWKTEIRRAIEERAIAFVACFSTAYAQRSRTYMNEELTVAIEEVRLRPRDRAWFFPVLLDEVKIPVLALGGGETLADIQQIRVFEDPQAEIRKLAEAILGLTEPWTPTG